VATSKGEGLVPTRELSLAPGADHRRTYPVDTELRVVVVSRDSRSGKVRFSVQKVAQVEERNNYREFHKGNDQQDSSSAMGSLGELMAKKFPGLTQEVARSAPKPAITRETPPPVAKPKPAALPVEKPLDKSASFAAHGGSQAQSAPTPAQQPAPSDRDGIKRRRK
jgi:hypothetical protein